MSMVAFATLRVMTGSSEADVHMNKCLRSGFLISWSPAWLDPSINRLLMLIDPSGYRWLNETWLKVDRGVEFYNSSSIRFDTGFVLSRLAFILAGLAAVVVSQRHFARSLDGPTKSDDPRGRAKGFPSRNTMSASISGRPRITLLLSSWSREYLPTLAMTAT